jgi:hypothetical protein
MIKFKVEFHCVPSYNDYDREFETLDAAKLYVDKTMSKLMRYCREIRATINGYTEYERYELSLNGNLEFDSEEKALASTTVLLHTMEKLLDCKLDNDFYEKMFSVSKKVKKIQAQQINYFYKTDSIPLGSCD